MKNTAPIATNESSGRTGEFQSIALNRKGITDYLVGKTHPYYPGCRNNRYDRKSLSNQAIRTLSAIADSFDEGKFAGPGKAIATATALGDA